jgi:hypothetical protein
MAAPKGRKPTVEYRYVPTTGQHEIGVKLEGKFVRFASVADSYANQLVQNAGDQADEPGDNGDENGDNGDTTEKA